MAWWQSRPARKIFSPVPSRVFSQTVPSCPVPLYFLIFASRPRTGRDGTNPASRRSLDWSYSLLSGTEWLFSTVSSWDHRYIPAKHSFVSPKHFYKLANSFVGLAVRLKHVLLDAHQSERLVVFGRISLRNPVGGYRLFSALAIYTLMQMNRFTRSIGTINRQRHRCSFSIWLKSVPLVLSETK